jgi:anti-sigma factor RsiW
MSCTEGLRVQACFDGELPANAIADIETHLAGCADCRVLLEDLERGRAVLKRSIPDLQAPPQLRANILAALDAEEANAARVVNIVRERAPRRRTFWWGALAGAGLSALAASVFLFIVLPTMQTPLVNGLLSAHLQSLAPDRLISVVSSDHHTVKPWFAGHADVSPSVTDFAEQGFALEGGRADELLGQRAAVMVYRHGKHTINVFAWSDETLALPRSKTRNGYHLLFWKSGDLAYAAVSDTSWQELQNLERLVQAHSAADLADAPR